VIDFALRIGSSAELAELIRQNDVLAAPQLLTFEVINIVRRQVLAKLCTEERAEEGIKLFRQLNFEFYETELLIERIWQLRHNFTAYDAAYVALAETLEVPFYTSDLRLANSSGHHAQIIKL
jgi:predicted nucleic acid-binding protein